MKKSTVFLNIGILFILMTLSSKMVIADSFIDTFKKSYNESFNKGFKDGYRKRFVNDCEKGDLKKEYLAYCECCADESLSQLTIKQLQDKDFALDYIKRNIVPGCAEKNIQSKHNTK